MDKFKLVVESPIVLLVGVIFTIAGGPLLLILEGKFATAGILLLVVGFIVFIVNFHFIMTTVLFEFQEMKGKVDNNRTEFFCVNNCKGELINQINSNRVEIDNKFISMTGLINGIHEQVEKNSECFEVIVFEDNKILIISNENLSKEYKIVMKGKNVDRMRLSSSISSGFKDVNEIELKPINGIDISNVEAMFSIETKIGLNFGLMQVYKPDSIDIETIVIDFIYEDKIACKSIKLRV